MLQYSLIVNKSKYKYYYNRFLGKGSYKDRSIFAWYKSYILIELTLLEELISLKQAQQKSVIFVTIGIFKIIVLSFNQMSDIDVMIYYWRLGPIAMLLF